MKTTDEPDDNRAELRAVSDTDGDLNASEPEQSTASTWGDVFNSLRNPAEDTAPAPEPKKSTRKQRKAAKKAASTSAAEATTEDSPAADVAGPVKRTPQAPAGRTRPASGARRPARDSRAGRGSRAPREPMNPVVKGSIAGVAVLAVVAVAVIGGRSVMGDQTPVTASSTESKVTPPSETPEPPQTSAASVPNRGLPPDDVEVVSGDCEPSSDQERITPSSKSLRSVVADFQANYFTKNVDALKATISKQNKEWRDQDWDAVLAQIPSDASYCLTMSPQEATSITSTVRMSVPGESDQVFRSRVIGERGEAGRWLVKEMLPVETDTN